MRIFEDIRAKELKLYSLYVNTSGYAFIQFWPSKKKKYFFPNEKGYIFINGRKINLKRLIYSVTYPKINLSNKVIVKLKGNTFSIFNLFALTKNQLRLVLKYKLEVTKNMCTGECALLPVVEIKK